MRNGSAVADGNDGHVLLVPPADSLKLMKIILTHEGVKQDLPFAINAISLIAREPRATPRLSTLLRRMWMSRALRLLLENGSSSCGPKGMEQLPLMGGGGAQFSREDRPTSDASYIEAVKLCMDAGNDINAAEYGWQYRASPLRRRGARETVIPSFNTWLITVLTLMPKPPVDGLLLIGRKANAPEVSAADFAKMKRPSGAPSRYFKS